ncbi:unnamed protein product [Paramecium sonneborni]|uniref:Transmembrane protein n=1 Tax=Paramecium sonneborni TaxID=65129 RepID=A0A8S1RHJ3_9CILI|nr:unnamed protein product [Paramecium sonneborni]
MNPSKVLQIQAFNIGIKTVMKSKKLDLGDNKEDYIILCTKTELEFIENLENINLLYLFVYFRIQELLERIIYYKKIKKQDYLKIKICVWISYQMFVINIIKINNLIIIFLINLRLDLIQQLQFQSNQRFQFLILILIYSQIIILNNLRFHQVIIKELLQMLQLQMVLLKMIIPKSEQYYKIAKQLTSLESVLINTQTNEVAIAVRRAKHNPKKFRYVNSSLFQSNKIGGLVSKIMPNKQKTISSIVLFANIKVVHNGLVLINTTASDIATSLNDKRQHINPRLPINPLAISFLIILLQQGYVLLDMKLYNI